MLGVGVKKNRRKAVVEGYRRGVYLVAMTSRSKNRVELAGMGPTALGP